MTSHFATRRLLGIFLGAALLGYLAGMAMGKNADEVLKGDDDWHLYSRNGALDHYLPRLSVASKAESWFTTGLGCLPASLRPPTGNGSWRRVLHPLDLDRVSIDPE